MLSKAAKSGGRVHEKVAGATRRGLGFSKIDESSGMVQTSVDTASDGSFTSESEGAFAGPGATCSAGLNKPFHHPFSAEVESI